MSAEFVIAIWALGFIVAWPVYTVMIVRRVADPEVAKWAALLAAPTALIWPLVVPVQIVNTIAGKLA